MYSFLFLVVRPLLLVAMHLFLVAYCRSMVMYESTQKRGTERQQLLFLILASCALCKPFSNFANKAPAVCSNSALVLASLKAKQGGKATVK